MSNIIYSISEDFFPATKSHHNKGITKKSIAVSPNIQKEESSGFTFLRGLRDETKFILGVIYFFLLSFFTIILFI